MTSPLNHKRLPLRAFLTIVCFAAAVHPAAAQTLTLQRTFHHHDVSHLVFSPDSKILATGGGDWATPDCVRLWDVATGKLLHTLRDRRDDFNIDSLAFSPDGRTVAYACDDKVRLWNVQTGRLVQVFSGKLVGNIEISPHGRLLVSSSGMDEGGYYSDVQIWDLRTGGRHTLRRSNGVDNIAFSPDGQHLIGINSEDDADNSPFQRIWNAGTGKVEQTRLLPRKTLALNISADSRFFAAGIWDAKQQDSVSVWTTQTGKRLFALHGPYHRVSDAAFSPGDALLATGGDIDDKHSWGNLILWDLHTGQLLQARKTPANVLSVTFSPDRHLLASASENGTVQLWQIH